MAEGDELRTHLNSALDGVDGWLDLSEAWQLHEEVRLGFEPPERPLCVVEIGSWVGRSTIALGLGTRARPGGGRVYAIDPHIDADHRAGELAANIRGAGLEDVAEPVRATSVEARNRFPDGSVDFLFVDGDHAYESVVTDVEAYRKALAPGAIIAFNDLFLPGVARAVSDRILTPGSPFRAPRFVYNTLWFDYRPERPATVAERVDLRRLRWFLAFGHRSLPIYLKLKNSSRVPSWVRRGQHAAWRMALWNLFPRPDRRRWMGRA
jgi:hypothetical protein